MKVRISDVFVEEALAIPMIKEDKIAIVNGTEAPYTNGPRSQISTAVKAVENQF